MGRVQLKPSCDRTDVIIHRGRLEVYIVRIDEFIVLDIVLCEHHANIFRGRGYDIKMEA